MKMYLSGYQAMAGDPGGIECTRDLIRRGILKYRCFSFAFLCPDFPYFNANLLKAHQLCVKHKIGIMMDSGAFSYRRLVRQGHVDLPEAEFIAQYVCFCKDNSSAWDFYVTMDLEVNVDQILARTEALEKRGLRPVPVFHGDGSVDILKRYLDKGYAFIALGTDKKQRTDVTKKRRFLDAVFDFGAKHNQTYHGLAMTAPWQIVGYPWQSVDSSVWLRRAVVGIITRYNPETNRISDFSISHRTSKLPEMQVLSKLLAEEGWDSGLLASSASERMKYNAHTMMQMAQNSSKNSSIGWNLLF